MAAADIHRMLIESAMPTYDVVIAEHTVVEADPGTTFTAVRKLDLLTVRTPVLTLSFWIRGLPARWQGRSPAPLPRLVLEDMALPGWLVLGVQPDREFAFGAVGRFWQPVIEWHPVTPEEFRSFAESGWGKIAANLSVRPYGESASLLSYECRTSTTDPGSRRRFLRYWWFIRPFVAHILRATLQQIKDDAEACPPPNPAPISGSR
ncbi:hypothetical protein [Mycolicibacterium fluoranthenivorans]|uniref:DUF2867 domain-containing protein n=1 Tax=Mycolicibacterium fluoranthenivorans TaxID=258505 RepID=A0A7X5U027_9MYCO|nr:hypothetical protein [Mycolicibacterium fluoranthenivorans]MCV7357982.1 hypothetical protein [Mycolicibacterium fluoranthenivorans]NIH95899.1 hypothetical protein [Mycolicibacterium fluoranthenivorans]